MYGCDISEPLIRLAVERHGLDPEKMIVCDATRLPYDDDYFDYSYSIGSLEHFTERGITEFLQACHRTTQYISFHQIPTSRKGLDEGWIVVQQAYHLNSIDWWEAKCREVFDEVHINESNWSNPLAVGVWQVCVKARP